MISPRFFEVRRVFLCVIVFVLSQLSAVRLFAASASFPEQPLYFEQNDGQAANGVKFIARSRDGVFCVGPNEVTMTLRKSGSLFNRSTGSSGQVRTVHLQFLGANDKAQMHGTGKLRGNVNYLTGNDPGNWHRSVPTFTAVEVQEAYPGIKLIHYGNQRELEYDFIVAPYADPGAIAFRVTGADELEIDEEGDLVLKVGEEHIRQKKPVIYQIDRGQRKQINGNYRLVNGETVTFQVEPYDTTLPLVIDPVLSYSSFLGELANDFGRAVVLDGSGNVYVAGDTLSTQLGTGNAYQPAYMGGYPAAGGDAFIAKFDPSGTNLIYLTYLGGNGDDAATSLAVDTEGNLYITGVTDSTNFPIPAVTITNRIAGKGELYFGLHPFDAFVAKLSPDGTQLIYATYLGGSGQDQGLGIVVDSNSCAYIVGVTESTNFPTTPGAFQTTLRGKTDVFVTKIASNGMSFMYSTFLGGTNLDRGESIAVDSGGRAYVTGSTLSTNFPISTNAFQTNIPTTVLYSQAFVSMLDSSGSSLVQSTYIGGLGNAAGYHIRLDNAGNVYVTGSEAGPGFPITPSPLNPGGIFKSSDGAANWSPSNLGLLHNEVHAIGIDPVNDANLYASTGRGIARSTNAGASWQVSLDSFDEVVTFAIDPVQPSTIYAGAAQVLKSTDSGLSWFSSSTGLAKSVTSPTNVFVTINKLVIDPITPATLYAGTENGIYKTMDGAATWRSSSSGLGTLAILDLAIDPSNPTNLYAATTSGIFRSTNNGVKWKAFNEGLTNLSASSLTFDSATPPAVYVGLGNGSLYKRGSSDTNWIFLNAGLVATNSLFTNTVSLGSITLLAGDPVTPSIIYAGTRGGLFKSVDGGINWNVATNGLPGLPIAALAIDRVAPSTLYVGNFNSFAGTDAFITKFNPDLTSIVYSATLGGSGFDQGIGLDVDNSGNAYVFGSTTSLDFPTYQPIGYPFSFNSGASDVFLAVINSDGSDFIYSTYLGGSGNDFPGGIALDSSGNAWMVGRTFSPDFPTTGNTQPFRGPSDGFIAKVSPNAPLVDVTLETTPSGISLFVDGTTNPTPLIVQWAVGSYHTIAAVPQSADTNIQYAWISWNDGGELLRNVAAVENTNYTANFKLQYFLTMASTNITVTDTNLAINATNSGALTPASGWYDAGTNLTIGATAPQRDEFVGWVGEGQGSFSGSNNPAGITMNGPITQTALFSGPLTNRMRVVIVGEGSVSPNYNGQALRVGKTYTMTAKPKSGSVFSMWTATGFQSTKPKLSFIMTNGLVLQAEFVPTPFVPAVGNYAGLAFNTNAVAFESSGFFTATIKDSGVMSAKLQIAGKTYGFSGQFAADGSLVIPVPRLGLSTLGLTLQLDLTGTSNVLTGQINSGLWTAELVANRAVFSKTNSPPQSGKRYTLVLPGAPESLTEPGGDGYGTVTVDNLGNISFSGKLGDGSTVSQKTFISAHGEWPFFVSLYSGNGVILGWLVFSDEVDTDLHGTIGWLKLPRPFTSSYTAGFTIQSEAAGSLYSFTNGVPLLPLNDGNGRLILENALLSQPITNSFFLDSANKVTSPDKLTLTITTSSGLFRGSATDPATGKALSFNGVLLQKQNRGAGYFKQADQTGRVRLEPQF